VDNVLLDEYQKVFPGGPGQSLNPFEPFRDWGKQILAAHYAREALASRYAWAVPTEKALARVAAHSPLVEVGAGTGYWAALLAARGAEVVAYDCNPPGGLHPVGALPDEHWTEEFGRAAVNYWGHRDSYFPVQFSGPEAVALHPGRTLFLCWPPYEGGEEFLRACLAHYRGGVLLYAGEWDGCTSWYPGFAGGEDDDACDWRKAEVISLPQWEGLHDALYVFHRRK
jgi:hypothetical protein